MPPGATAAAGYGIRSATWWVVQHVEDVPADEIAIRLQDPKYAEAMARAQTSLDAELGTGGNNWSSPPVL